MNILNTEEVCRIHYFDNESDYKRLIKQTYTNQEPFYCIETNTGTRLETSDTSLLNVIKQLQKEIKIAINSSKSKSVKGNDKVYSIHMQVIGKEQEFLNMVVKYRISELNKMISDNLTNFENSSKKVAEQIKKIKERETLESIIMN